MITNLRKIRLCIVALVVTTPALAQDQPQANDLSNPFYSVRPNGAVHQWRKEPPRELSVDPGS